jgi:alkaline phosphatase
LVRTLLRADRHEEPQQDESAGDEQPQHQPNVVLGGEDAHDDQDEADREQDRATQVEGPGRVRRSGSFTFRLSRRSVAMISAWKAC